MAGLAAMLALAGAACSSAGTSSGSPATSSSSSSSPSGSVTVKPFAAHPAPSGGNGGSNGQAGVTATSINVGSPVSVGNGVSNAQLATYLGAEAYYDMVNASGGIYGRKLSLTEMNTTFDPNVGLSVFTKYIPQMFALNGTASDDDSIGYNLVKSSGIPWVGLWFDPQYYALPNAVNFEQAENELPFGQGANGVSQLFKKANPAISKVAVIWLNTPGIQPFVNEDVASWASVGVQTVYNVGVSGTAANLTPYVIQARSKGADVMDAETLDITEAARLAQAMAQQGWKPTLATNYSVYDPTWHTLAGAGAAGWQSSNTWDLIPFLDDNALNATTGGAQFLYWYQKVAGSQPITNHSASGWVQAAFFVQGLIDAGPKLTRAGLLSALNGIRDFTADGMIASQPRPAAKGTAPATYCGSIFQATSSGFQQILPASGTFSCVPQKVFSYSMGT
jgi:ABC-type branched-subunit amino acid transport system substrate-binding protein